MSLTRSKAVVELGRRLVDQLDLEGDLLASWLAHYISELMERARQAPAGEKEVAEAECARAILELWRHRYALPNGAGPLLEFEPIVEMIRLLDAQHEDYRYFPSLFRELAMRRLGEEGLQWLKLAGSVDSAARVLIKFALSSAAEQIADGAADWLDLAEEAGGDQAGEAAIVGLAKLVDSDGDRGGVLRHAELTFMLSKLDRFSSIVGPLAECLRQQLGSSADSTSARADAAQGAGSAVADSGLDPEKVEAPAEVPHSDEPE